MHWYFWVAYFFGCASLINAAPHFVNGVSGRSFPTPFVSPPGKGLSSPMVNVLWGKLNAVVRYFLVSHVGEFHIRAGSIKLAKCSTLIRLSFNEQAEK